MKKTFLSIACFIAIMCSAQSNSWAQQFVDKIVADISVSAEQVQQLQLVISEYVSAIQEANQQYTDDTERTKAKEIIFKKYQSSLQEILTEEQYAELMLVREERRNQRITQ